MLQRIVQVFVGLALLLELSEVVVLLDIAIDVIDEVKHTALARRTQVQLVYPMLGYLRQQLRILKVGCERPIFQFGQRWYAQAVLRFVGVVLTLGHRVMEPNLVGHVLADVQAAGSARGERVRR